MDIETLIRAWKDAKFRSTLSSDELLPNPAGLRLVELDEEEIRSIWGAEGVASDITEGYICSLSAECQGTPVGESCWST